MIAVCEALCVQTPSDKSRAPRGGGIAIIAERPADIARIEQSLARFDAGRREIAYRGALSGFEIRNAEVVLLQTGPLPGVAQCAQIEALSRGCKLVLIGDSRLRDAWASVKSARAWAFVDCQDLSSGALNNAIFGLERARASEDRLLRALSDQGAELRRLASVAALAQPAIARSQATLYEFANARFDGEAAGRAFDAADELQLLNEEISETLKSVERAQRARGPADLNQIVEAFVRDNVAAGTAHLSAQTGRDPIPVKPEAKGAARIARCDAACLASESPSPRQAGTPGLGSRPGGAAGDRSVQFLCRRQRSGAHLYRSAQYLPDAASLGPSLRSDSGSRRPFRLRGGDDLATQATARRRCIRITPAGSATERLVLAFDATPCRHRGRSEAIHHANARQSPLGQRGFLQGDQLSDAASGKRQQAHQLRLAERRAFGGALHFDEASRPCHHEIGVGFGG
jgi:hypothetical protein